MSHRRMVTIPHVHSLDSLVHITGVGRDDTARNLPRKILGKRIKYFYYVIIS